VSKGSIIDMQDEKLNTDIKRSLRGAFSAKNVLEFDDEVDKQILALKTRIQEDGTVAMMELLSQYQIDFFMKVAFGQTSHFLEHRTPTAKFSFMSRMKHWQQFQGLFNLEFLFNQTWVANLFARKRGPSAWMSLAMSSIKSGMDCAESGEKTGAERKDLLGKYIQARLSHPQLFDDEALLRMVSSTVSAGFDSTPFTMNNIIFFLCKNPDAYAKLKHEINEAHKHGNLSEVPKWTEVNKLPYLDTVIKEAMRMSPFLNLPLEREVPASGTEINGFHLPARTIVGCHPTLVGRDRAFYGQYADKFMPERWLAENRVAMERNSLTFGSGKRMCIGLHIAELEMKKTIPVIIRDFDVSTLEHHDYT
jgi:cytochrome P450